jgi:hypothetical protein
VAPKVAISLDHQGGAGTAADVDGYLIRLLMVEGALDALARGEGGHHMILAGNL